MTKEELIRKAELILEEDKVREYDFHKYVLGSPDALSADALKIHDNLCNFILELIDLLNKYNIEISSINGGWETLAIQEPKGKVAIGVSSLEELKKFSIEELEKRLEDAKALMKSRKESQNNENVNEEEASDEYDDWGEEDPEEECEYDASAVFTANIEYEFTFNGEIPQEDEEKLKKLALKKVESLLDNQRVYIEDYIDDNMSIEHIEDNKYKLVVKDVSFSAGVTVLGYSWDQCNDKRWKAFYDKVKSIEYLSDIRDEEVSEVD